MATNELVVAGLKVSALLVSLDPSNKTTYMLPGIPPAKEGEESPTICRNAIQRLLIILYRGAC